ncbi:carboxypeptidase-like regulatory domain-containing protein, partial [Singulisphaera rosea]
PAIVATPGRAVSGIVRDRDSGKPLSKLRVQSFSYPYNSALTDERGRYRLIGAVTDEAVSLSVMPEGEPYPRTSRKLDTPGHPASITADLTLTRGVEVNGKVTDGLSGRPVSSWVRYHPFREAPDGAIGSETPEQSDVLTDANGRFRLELGARSKDEFPTDLPMRYFVAASAPGYGFGMVEIGASGRPEVIQLVEDLPLTGRIIDLEGRPVVGATIRPRWLWSPNNGDLSTRLRAYSRVESPQVHEIPSVNGWVEGMIPPAVTGADGRFHIEGLGRERILTALVEGPTIETAEFSIMTRRTETVRPMPRLEGPGGSYSPYIMRVVPSDLPQILGSNSDLIAARTQPVTGLVRDRETGRPLAGVEVGTSHYIASTHVKATTDHDGRYRLVGLPIGRKIDFSAVAPDDQPYFQGNHSLTIRPGESTDVSFDLRRGLWIRGRAIDRSTGRPVSGVATYFPFEDNLHASKDDALGDLNLDRKRANWNKSDGSYRIVGLPGHGLVAFRTNRWAYAMGLGAKEIRGEKIFSDFKTFPSCDPGSYHNLVEVNPPDHVSEITQDLVADPGRSVTVKTLDAEGNPLSGIVVIENPRTLGQHQIEASKSPEYVIHCLGPGETRTLTFWQQQRHLIARLTVRDDQSGPITMKLQPWGVVTGRLVSSRGELGGGVSVRGMDRAIIQENSRITLSINEATFHADKDGRFKVEGLVPGTKYNLQALEKYGTESFLAKDVSLAPGETRELGDVHTEPKREANR